MKKLLCYGLIASLAGCAAAPRYQAIELYGMTDPQICFAAMRASKSHPDAQIISSVYQGRLKRNAFTHEYCVEQYALLQKAELEKATENSRKLGEVLGTVLGVAIGAAAIGYANQPAPSYAPMGPARAYTPAPFVPYVPQPFVFSLLKQTVNSASTTKVCSYMGTATVIVLQPHEPCPDNVQR